jgi:arylsulfatase A-like enzyme
LKRREFLELVGGGTLSLVYGCSSDSSEPDAGNCTPVAAAGAPDRPNVLFVSIDDLNDWIGVLGGHPQALTPNIDRLAARGVLFSNAHCNAPVCKPSRTSVISGLRPTTTGLYRNDQDGFRRFYPDLVTLPQYFMRNGYRTVGGGKILDDPDPASWEEYWPGRNKIRGSDPEPGGRPANGLADVGNLDWGSLPETATPMGDQRLLSKWAVPNLQRGCLEQPFFMAVGIYKPHLPWYLPTESFAPFPPESTVLPEVLAGDRDDLPRAALRLLGSDDHQQIVDAGLWPDGVAAYLAAVYFADQVVGDLIAALETSAYADNTIVVLWSDNGFHLGEKERWRKQTLWHESTRVPLIFAVPGNLNAGATCVRPVSLLDIYPTLLELCELPPRDDLEGASLVPLLEDPNADWSLPAVSTRDIGTHAVISEEWRYIRYGNGNEELYDLSVDRNDWTNLAARSELASVKADLAAWLPAIEAPAP